MRATPNTNLTIAACRPSPQGRAWLSATLQEFLSQPRDSQLGRLTKGLSETGFTETSTQQLSVWQAELDFLTGEFRALIRDAPRSAHWTVLLEYSIPRRQARVDVVLLADQTVFAIEMKLGQSDFDRASLLQAEDYALDLRDFHRESRALEIVPILVCTGAPTDPHIRYGDELDVHCVGSTGLANRLGRHMRDESATERIDPSIWDRSAYQPTPTIVEATNHLFSNHSIAELSHSYADNLNGTIEAIKYAAEFASRQKRRTICFVTGVPGAGKTLAGLAAIHDLTSGGTADFSGAYLSGNGPLVQVLRESLARNAKVRGELKRDADRRAKTLIQNVHEFVTEYGINHPELEPYENVVIFDEAQRAWDATKLSSRHKTLNRSEPSLLLEAMRRTSDWSLVVALIGGGQEIHSGEAGLGEWGRAIASSEYPYAVFAPPEAILGGTSVASQRLFEDTPPQRIDLQEDERLHLDVSVRSPRAEKLAQWVNAILDCDVDSAQKALQDIRGFRIGFTRSLDSARAWLRDAARDELREGLLASSGNLRLRAYGIEMAPEFLSSYPIAHWFLNDRDDVRASHSLEVAMSEFKVQGLEIDLAGVLWGDDLTISETGAWSMRRFHGADWQTVSKETSRRYLLNKYRVLLTRAREGMVIWVPPGDRDDLTRDPARLDHSRGG